MSIERFDEDLRRGIVAWPRPERVMLVAWDAAWPAVFAACRAELAGPFGPGAVEHVGATAVPGLAAVPVVDLLVEVDDPAAATAPVLDRGFDPWFVTDEVRAFRRQVPDPVTLRLGRSGTCGPYRALRDRLAADVTARRRYTDVRRGLAGTWPDLRDYAAAKGPVVRALLAG